MANVSGNPKKDFFKNPIVKFSWYFLSLISTLVVGVLILAFFIMFGACYELIVCYMNGFREEDSPYENESNLFVYNNDSMSSAKTIKEDFKPNYFIVALLIFAGILLQPFYLCFKFLVALMECYKNYGCWFYFYAAS